MVHPRLLQAGRLRRPHRPNDRHRGLLRLRPLQGGGGAAQAHLLRGDEPGGRRGPGPDRPPGARHVQRRVLGRRGGGADRGGGDGRGGGKREDGAEGEAEGIGGGGCVQYSQNSLRLRYPYENFNILIIERFLWESFSGLN
ncbi:MAG: hypothetical protein METHAR1v1_770004 [Methanothrix sp.]|nr:MAG: hypothetical protein METHAR1v1_770004 [Methanothrix sp.]